MTIRHWIRSGIAVVGTIWYAWSFYGVAPRDVAWLASAVGVSAGLSWLVLGATLGLFARAVPVNHWFDVCLSSMTRGMTFLLVAATLNTFTPLWSRGEIMPVVLHLSLLLGAGVVMTSTFVALSGAHGVSITRALLLWVVGLHLPFVLLMLGYGVWRWL